MPTTSSLLSGAASTRKKIIEQQDSIRAYEWDLSEKSYDDYIEYKDYLENRANTAGDVSRQLAYTKKITSARRAFTSHEIQRQTIDVLEGNSSLQTKYNTMVDLFSYAVNNDDLDLAQSLRLQLDNLDRSIQSERMAGQAVADRMAKEQVTTVKDYADLVLKGENLPSGSLSLKELNNMFRANGDEGLNEIGKSAAEALGLPGVASYWDIYKTIVDDVLNMYETSASTLDPVNAQELITARNNLLDGQTLSVPGLGKISYQELNDAVDAQRAGQNLYVPSQRDGNNVFQKTKVTDYVWKRDINGNYSLLRVRDELADDFESDSKVPVRDKDGKIKLNKDGTVRYKSYKDVAKDAGFELIGTEDGRMVLRATNQTGDLGIPGLQGGQSFDAVIGENGSIRLLAKDQFGESNIYELGFDDNNRFQISKSDPSKISAFGDQYSAPTKEGVALTKAILGQSEVPTIKAGDSISALDKGDPYGRPITTTDIINTGERIAQLRQENTGVVADFGPASKYGSLKLQTRINTAAAKLQAATVNPQAVVSPQITAPTRAVQSAGVPKLNQTPVQNTGQIKVTPTPSAPRLSVTNPASTAKVSVVGPKPVQQQEKNKVQVNTGTPLMPGLKVQ